MLPLPSSRFLCPVRCPVAEQMAHLRALTLFFFALATHVRAQNFRLFRCPTGNNTVFYGATAVSYDNLIVGRCGVATFDNILDLNVTIDGVIPLSSCISQCKSSAPRSCSLYLISRAGSNPTRITGCMAWSWVPEDPSIGTYSRKSRRKFDHEYDADNLSRIG